MRYCVIFSLILLMSCYEVQRDCERFKTGIFQSEFTIDGQKFISEFERFSNLQIERFDGKIDSASVRWINDCEMIFKTINPQNRIEKKDIHLKILTTTKDTYTFEYGYVGDAKKQKGIAKRLN
ncbi:MAG: DNA topoisomerase IV [Flavobacteriaceae bacterium]